MVLLHWWYLQREIVNYLQNNHSSLLTMNIFTPSKQLLKFWKILTTSSEEMCGISIHSASDLKNIRKPTSHKPSTLV